MKQTIKKGSENYAAQVISLPHMNAVEGLDNLVQVTYQGNPCLVQKHSDKDALYLFFPAGSVLDPKFLSDNNLYRHTENNLDKTKAGFFENTGRVKAIKFKGVISTGFIIPINSLSYLIDPSALKQGDSFTDINDQPICWKFIRRTSGFNSGAGHSRFDLDSLVRPQFIPEHPDTAQLLKNSHHLHQNDMITITHKLHGTSIRIFHVPTKRRLSLLERLFKKVGVRLQEEEFSYMVGSRRVIKSCNFNLLDKPTVESDDLWTRVTYHTLKGKLHPGEAVYAEVVGSDYANGAIQQGYTYGLTSPKLFIYRIAQINQEGMEVDLGWPQVKQRAKELGVDTVPELFSGRLGDFLSKYSVPKDNQHDQTDIAAALEWVFYDQLLEQPSVLDEQVVEEGFVLRKESYPKASALKIKSRKFLLHETKMQDTEMVDLEEEN